MMPRFIITPTGKPDSIWDNPKEPCALLAHFIGSEIYLMLPTIDDFLNAVEKIQQEEKASWRWQGNSYSVEMTKHHCLITYDYPESLQEEEPVELELRPEELASVLSSWKKFVQNSFVANK